MEDHRVEHGLTWGENRNREPGEVHIEWHAPCGCAFHPKPFPHMHPCSNEHMRADLNSLPSLVCTECPYIFTEAEIAAEDKSTWAHPCHANVTERFGPKPMAWLAIDGETYEVDRTVAGAIDEMQTEIEQLRSVLWRLASFVGGAPCWCKLEGFEHSQACKDARVLWAKAS